MTAPPSSPHPRRYLLPRRRGWRSPGGVAAIVAAILLAGAIATVTTTSHTRLGSPGPLSRDHAAADVTCASCHSARAGVDDLRCLRCHADGGAERLMAINHAAAASPLRTTAALTAAAATCASCHDDHRGATFDMTGPADDRCTRCHAGVSMATHPEFAVLTRGPATGGGMALSHKRHMDEVRKLGKGCEACHQRGERDAAFAPLSFDRQCASCHLKSGLIDADSDPVDPALLLPVPAQTGSPVLIAAERGRVQVRAAHRDAWVLSNLQRWRQMISPETEAVDRLTAAERLAQLDSLLLAEGAGDATAAVDALAAQLQKPSTAVGGAVARADPRPRLLSLLDAIESRGDPALRASAARLRPQIEGVAAPQAVGDGDRQARAAALTAILRQLEAVPDAAARGDAAAVRALLQASPEGGRVAAAGRLLGLLDLVEARDSASADRVAALRRRVEQAMTDADAAAIRAGAAAGRADRQARAAIDAQLRDAVAVPARATPAPVVASDIAWLRQARSRLTGLIAAADRASAFPPLPSSATPEDVRHAAEALTRPCAKCHDTSGARISPVAAARPVLTGAAFSHAPHTNRRQCTDCHASARDSVTASEVNLPPIATCRTCHNDRVAPATCRTCHRYHQPPSAPLRDATWTMGSAF